MVGFRITWTLDTGAVGNLEETLKQKHSYENCLRIYIIHYKKTAVNPMKLCKVKGHYDRIVISQVASFL